MTSNTPNEDKNRFSSDNSKDWAAELVSSKADIRFAIEGIDKRHAERNKLFHLRDDKVKTLHQLYSEKDTLRSVESTSKLDLIKQNFSDVRFHQLVRQISDSHNRDFSFISLDNTQQGILLREIAAHYRCSKLLTRNDYINDFGIIDRFSPHAYAKSFITINDGLVLKNSAGMYIQVADNVRVEWTRMLEETISTMRDEAVKKVNEKLEEKDRQIDKLKTEINTVELRIDQKYHRVRHTFEQGIKLDYSSAIDVIDLNLAKIKSSPEVKLQKIDGEYCISLYDSPIVQLRPDGTGMAFVTTSKSKPFDQKLYHLSSSFTEKCSRILYLEAGDFVTLDLVRLQDDQIKAARDFFDLAIGTKRLFPTGDLPTLFSKAEIRKNENSRSIEPRHWGQEILSEMGPDRIIVGVLFNDSSVSCKVYKFKDFYIAEADHYGYATFVAQGEDAIPLFEQHSRRFLRIKKPEGLVGYVEHYGESESGKSKWLTDIKSLIEYS